MTVIVFSCTENPHANEVQSAVEELGHEVVRINYDKVPSNSPIFSVQSKNNSSISEFEIDNKKVQISEVTGVFLHHPKTFVDVDPKKLSDTEEVDVEFARANWSAAIHWLEAILPDAVWINKYSEAVHMSRTSYQLEVAKNLGFRTPHTLFTNDYQQVVSFFDEVNRVIVKLGNTNFSSYRNFKLHTSEVVIDELDAEILRRSPCLFQEYIDKAFELRVNVVKDQVFAAKIDSQSHKDTSIDFRANYDIDVEYSAYDLDDETKKRCIEFVSRSNLTMGIIDLIMTPAGDVVFLECNNAGHWLWIEDRTKQPITRSIALALTKEI